MLTGVYETLRSAGPRARARARASARASRRGSSELPRGRPLPRRRRGATDDMRATAARRGARSTTDDRAPDRLLDLCDLRAARRARRVLRGGAHAPSSRRRSTSWPRATATCSRSCSTASPPRTRRRRTASRRSTSRTSSCARATCCATTSAIREREQLRFRSIMVDEFQDTNRLQCELSTCSAAARGARAASSSATSSSRSTGSATRTSRSSASGARAARRRPAADQNYRSRPEVLAVVNHLFGGDFGDEFQPLAASGEFPDPVFGPPVELLVTDKSTYAGHERRTGGAARRRRSRAASASCRRRRRDRRRDRPPLRGRHRRRVVRGGAARARRADLPRHRPRLLRPAAGRRPARVPAAAAQPLRRRGARRRARLAARRRLERRARPAAPRGAEAPAVRRARARACPRRSRSATRSSSARSGSATTGWPRRSPRLSLERLCERIVAEHDYDLAVLAQWDGRRRYANLRKLARLARSYEELRGPDVEGFVRFVRDQEAVGARELEAVAEEEGGDAVRLLTIHAAKGLEFKVVVVADAGRDRAPPRVRRDPRALRRALRLPRRRPDHERARAARSPTRRCRRRARPRSGPSGCASTTSR